jgi:hypothetical protein
MKNSNDPASVPNSNELTQSQTTKLASLLALAAGAAAMPQTTEADVIYTDLSANPALVGFGTGFGSGYSITNLPGTAQIGLKTNTASTLAGTARLITVFQQAGYARFKTLSHFALPASANKLWNQILGNANNAGRVAVATFSGHYPGSYDHLYLPFEFKDSTAGNALRFGWMQVTLSNPSNGGNPSLTLFGYAYDDTGAQIPMGALGVPEPSSVGMMVLGALTLGAAGVRNWRGNKNPKSEDQDPKEARNPKA